MRTLFTTVKICQCVNIIWSISTYKHTSYWCTTHAGRPSNNFKLWRQWLGCSHLLVNGRYLRRYLFTDETQFSLHVIKTCKFLCLVGRESKQQHWNAPSNISTTIRQLWCRVNGRLSGLYIFGERLIFDCGSTFTEWYIYSFTRNFSVGKNKNVSATGRGISAFRTARHALRQ